MDDSFGLLTRAEASAALPTWRYLLGRMHLSVATGDFATALVLVDRVGAVAQAHGHHPEIDLRWGLVHMATGSHDAGGVTGRDVRLGKAVDAVVQELGLTAQPLRSVEIEIAIDALDHDAIRPFWAAVLDRPDTGGTELVDPDRVGPTVWFQSMDQSRPQRNRIHLDVTVSHDEAPGRLARALAAGGQLVSDTHAPSFWVLSDIEGNEACLCTWQSRD
jgi:4a-hydroxytetrahydrobiopterin dehydratase